MITNNKTLSFKIFAGLLLLTGAIGLISATSPKHNKKHSAIENTALNVVYGHNINHLGADESLDMDIYMPSKIEKGRKYPLVMMIHGGTFINGNKNGLGKACALLADSGFVGVTINYRLGWNIPKRSDGCSADISDSENATYRAFQDARAALRFLAHNADKYHIDKNWFFVGGGSAGAIAALGTTYIDEKYASAKMPMQVKTLGNLNTASNDLKDTYKIKGIIDMWGALPDSTLINASTAVPTIMFHGTKDMVVPYDKGTWRSECPNFPALYGSACLYRQMVKAKQPALLTSIIGGKHGPVELGHDAAITNSSCFLHGVIRGNPKTGSYTNVVIGCRE